MIPVFLLTPGEFDQLARQVLEAMPDGTPKEFDFEKHFYHGLTRKIWNEYGLRSHVVEKVLRVEPGMAHE